MHQNKYVSIEGPICLQVAIIKEKTQFINHNLAIVLAHACYLVVHSSLPLTFLRLLVTGLASHEPPIKRIGQRHYGEKLAGKMGMFSMSCVATVATIAYAYFGLSNIYQLMNPLSRVDLSIYPPNQMINPLWDMENDEYQMKVYLSHSQQFSMSFLQADEYTDDNLLSEDKEEESKPRLPAVLLWNDPAVGKTKSGMDRTSLSKSFVITPKNQPQECLQPTDDENTQNPQCLEKDITKLGFQTALTWFDPKTSSSLASTSIILTLYNSVRKTLGLESDDDAANKDKKEPPQTIQVDEDGPIWNALMKNNTLHAHVLLIRKPKNFQSLPVSAGYQARSQELGRLANSNSVILGTVNLVKHDDPNPHKPTRILYHDLSYIFQRYILQKTDLASPPWELHQTQPKEFDEWQTALHDKANKVGYPYWKPEVAIRLVSEDAQYPIDMASVSGMEIVKLKQVKSEHPSGFAYIPPLHVDEMGLTSEKYVPLNGTVAAIPLRITLDTHGLGGAALTPQRWRLLQHMTNALQAQKESGLFEESDIDDVKSLIADTNVTLLGITTLASLLHLLFEFLTFKSDVEFWKDNTDLTGLSVRALFLDVLCQSIILAYLIEMDSSLLMTVPSGVGILIAMWKCHRGAGLKIVRKSGKDADCNLFNKFISITGFEVQATRLNRPKPKADEKKDKMAKKKDDLAALTDEMDRVATRTLGAILLPVVVFYAFYTLIVDEYSGWYSWLITTSSSAVYALGFALMTPQLFLNYKLKSVAHLPWRVLCYKFLNTFIDDLFAFIIRMPTMARISCFRDDVVFIVYLAQRYMYPVDTSRPVEGGGAGSSDDQQKKDN